MYAAKLVTVVVPIVFIRQEVIINVFNSGLGNDDIIIMFRS